MSVERKGNWPEVARGAMVQGRVIDAQPDVPDRRDWIYQPPLIPLKASIEPDGCRWWSASRVRDQGHEPSCTGHALAAAIDHLLARKMLEDEAPKPIIGAHATLAEPFASALMLYWLAACTL